MAGVDTLILRDLECTFSVAREWTDWATRSLYDSLNVPQRLALDSLLELVILLEQLTQSASEKGVDK